MAARAIPFTKRFWSKVDTSGECWLWTACIGTDGYGQFGCGPNTEIRTRKAHRIAYILTHGAIPEGMELDHLCRNRACVNPAHLEPVDHSTNVLRGAAGVLRDPTKPRKRATHCKNGHVLTPENLGALRTRPTTRRCRICHNERARQANSRRKSGNTDTRDGMRRDLALAWQQLGEVA